MATPNELTVTSGEVVHANDISLHGYSTTATACAVLHADGQPCLSGSITATTEPQGSYPHVMALVRAMPWAITPGKLATIMDLLRFRSEGGRLTAEEIQQRIGAARPAARASAGAVAVIPVMGVISQRVSMMSEMSGGTSTERIGAAFAQALNDPAVGSIVLQIDSPGGGVYGVAELADTIFKARGQKPIIAVADSLAASAAYWIAASADEISVTPSGEVGSIGVFAAHEDVSRMLEAAGVSVNLISAGKYKTEGSPYEPLGDEARAAMQSRVDDYYQLFTGAVARGRGVKVTHVLTGFGEGRVVGAQEAVTLGMADRVETIDQAISRLMGGRSRSIGQRAEDAAPEIAASVLSDIDLRRRRMRLLAH